MSVIKEIDYNFPIDIVYTWVDDTDPKWRNKKKEVLKNNSVNIEANENCRFINNDELLFSIRSIYKFCPWFNKIYIVTDEQKPKWLDENNNDIIIIDHKIIFNNIGLLPTFNSNMIESRIHHIPNLSENYIYLNDDFFIGRLLTKSFFFYPDGSPKIYMTKTKPFRKVLNRIRSKKLIKQKLYSRNLNFARKIIFERDNKLILNYPIHNPKAFCKSQVHKIENYFKNIILKTLTHQFRHNDGIYFLALCLFHLIAKGNKPIIMKPYRNKKISYNFSFFRKNRDFIYIKLGIDPLFKIKYELIKKFNPAFFCINDTNLSTNTDRAKMVKFLTEYFPNRSIAEK